MKEYHFIPRPGYNWKMISDPLYGYVYFNEIEEPIINNVLVQRLRYIMQLQTAHLVYPGAVHTRFQHSLGVMHLAGIVAEELTAKLISIHGHEILDGYKPTILIEAMRIAGLLHDVGHAPFGHSFEHSILWEKNMPSEVSSHERIGHVLVKLLLDEYLEKVDRELNGVRELVYALLGDMSVKGVIKIYKWILTEGLYPVDVVDYLRRDSYYAGTSEYGFIAYERLYRNTYPFLYDEGWVLVLDRVALGELRQYMRARASMFEHVYYHSVCRAFDKMLDEILKNLDKELDLTQRVLAITGKDPWGYLELIDAFLYSVMFQKARHEQSRLGYLCRRILMDRKPLWRRVGKDVVLPGYRDPRMFKETLRIILDKGKRLKIAQSLQLLLADALKSDNVGEDDVWVDVLDISPVPRSLLCPSKGSLHKQPVLYLGKRVEKEIILDTDFSPFEDGSPFMVIFRAYISREKYDIRFESKVSSILMDALKSMLGLSDDEYKKAIREIYKEITGINFLGRE
ncbi:MAG: HD domain-containing protein [Desulfurococcaceae archaeon]